MNNKKTPKEYRKYVKQRAPKSKVLLNTIKAFITGGVICTIGQVIMNILKNLGLGMDIASTITTIAMIFLGAFLTAINIYDEIAQFGGAGSTIPVTGFANSIVSPALEYKREGYVMGVGAKMFTIAGPVLVYGICSSIVVGIIYFIGINI